MGRKKEIAAPLDGDAIILRMREACDVRTDKELAEILDCSRQNISTARRSNRIPPVWFQKVSIASGTSIDWLFWGDDPPCGMGNMRNIPAIAGQASESGEPVILNGNTVINLHQRFLERFGEPGQMALFMASGDAMSPTISDGDLVLIDRSIVTVGVGKIHALILGGFVCLRRIEPALHGLWLKGDSPSCEAYAVENREQLRIIGRAVWAGRTL